MSRNKLRRELGLLETTMMGIGGAICAGVFVTLGYAATLAGTALIVAILFCGVINFFTMLSYAELGAALPTAGGEYTFAKVSFGGFFSFATGWFEWVSNMFYAAFSSVGFAYVISYVFPGINVPLVAVATLAAFSLVNLKGVKETGLTQTGLVLVLIGLLAAFAVAGIFMGQNGGGLELNAPTGAFGVLRASAFIFVIYLGGEAVAVAQAEVKNPEKTVPRAIILSCLALIVIYSVIAFVVFKTVQPEDLTGQSSPLAFVAQQFMGPTGVAMITVAGIIAALTSVNTSIMAASRVAYALARDGYFPKRLYSLHSRFSTPHIALLVGAVFTFAVAATGLANFLVYATDFGFIIGFVLVNLSLIKLRRSKPSLPRPFKVPLYPLTPLLGVITSFLLIFLLEPSTLFLGVELFLFGLVAYYIRMVGYSRVYLAMAGIDFGLSGFAALLGYLLASNALPITLSTNLNWIVLTIASIVSLSYLAAGILNVTRRVDGE